MRGVELVVEADEAEEDGAWYVHELVGLGASARRQVVGRWSDLDAHARAGPADCARAERHTAP